MRASSRHATADPTRSRTARLLRSGRAKMAKKLAEEAVEVVIDAMNGSRDAVVEGKRRPALQSRRALGRGGVQPKEVWKEMERRERLFGIAEKLLKSRPSRSAPQGGGARQPPLPQAALILRPRRSPQRMDFPAASLDRRDQCPSWACAPKSVLIPPC
jgi:phosphoribosyl-ATP pyrophosphohydrolase